MAPTRETVSLLFLTTLFALSGCSKPPVDTPAGPQTTIAEESAPTYASVRLTSDLSVLGQDERDMLPLLIAAADEMNAVFWQQAYGDPGPLLADVDDPELLELIEINYGPWDRLDGNRPLLHGVGAKPAGSNFYPRDATAEEVKSAIAAARDAGDDERAAALASEYTLVRRDDAGELVTIPYNVAFSEHFEAAAAKLDEAAALAPQESLRRYLELRAEALRSNVYRPSDLAWMEMKDNRLDIVIGPIESYEDALLGIRTAAESYVLIKDLEWSERLKRYADFLPDLQQALPVEAEYRTETPGTDSDLGAYDVVYYAGDCNAGSKTIAINLPNDEQVQLEKGTRRLQLKNAMRAKFDRILLPIAEVLIAPQQRDQISFDAFFSNTMFHEVAHGLGIKNTIDGSGTVRERLAEHAGTLEEGKADVLGLFMLGWLIDNGHLEADIQSSYVTFLASIFRSIRFGSASAHGRANLIRFNYFADRGAFRRSDEGLYSVDFPRMKSAVEALSADLLRLQGNGDHAATTEFVGKWGVEGETLRDDLQRLEERGIAVDIVFEQGMDVLAGNGA